ncbi:MAG: porin family protein [Bacteroidales bacterium]
MYKNLAWTMNTIRMITVLMMVLVPFTGTAQVQQRPVNLLILGGIHGSWLNPDETMPAGGRARMGLSAGLRMDYNFHPHFSLSWGVGILQAGGSVIYSDGLYADLDSGPVFLQRGATVTYRTQLMETTAALKLQTNRIGYTRFFLEAGLDPLFRLKNTINASNPELKKEPYTEGTPWFNLAYHTAIGFRYSFTRLLGFQASIFYRNSFLDFTNRSPLQPADLIRLNQAGISLALTLL